MLPSISNFYVGLLQFIPRDPAAVKRIFSVKVVAAEVGFAVCHTIWDELAPSSIDFMAFVAPPARVETV